MDERALSTLRKWVLAGAIYNFVSGLPLMFPVIYRQNYVMFTGIANALGLGGQDPVPPDEAINSLFVNFGFLLLISIGVLLIWASRNLRERLAIVFINAATRIASILLFLYYVFVEGATHILLVFLVADLLFTIVFLYYINKVRGLAPRTWLD